MRKLLIFIALTFSLFISGFTPYQTDEIKTFILVRHAEKVDDSQDPVLSEDGIARSYYLDYMLELLNPDAIYTSPYNRTRETIHHIAERYSIEPIVYDPQSQDLLVKEWLESKNGFTYVISGHSNTIPELANLLLNRTHFDEDFDESDYGNLLIITVTNNESNILHLRY